MAREREAEGGYSPKERRAGEEEGRRRTWRGRGSVVEAGEPSCEELGVYVGDDKGEREATSAFGWGGGKGQAHDETRPG